MDHHKSGSFCLFKHQLTGHRLRETFANQSPSLTCCPKHWDTTSYSISLNFNFHLSDCHHRIDLFLLADNLLQLLNLILFAIKYIFLLYNVRLNFYGGERQGGGVVPVP